MFLWRLKVRQHTSSILLALAIGLIAGVAISFLLRLTLMSSVVWLLLAGLLAILAFVWRSTFAIGMAVVAGGLLGCFRTNFTTVDIQNVQSLNGQVVQVAGVVFEDPDTKEDGSLTLKLNNLEVAGRALSGNVYIGKLGRQDIKRGDHVELYGKLSDGFGNFSAAMYRPKVDKVTRPTPGDLAGRARDWFGGLVRQVVGETEASLGLGYLLGQRRSLPSSLVEVLKITGLTHIVVASGYNLTVLVRFSRRLFMRVSRFAALFFALLLVVCFIMVTGVSPSMLRAGMVSILSLLAWFYGRKFHPINLLVLVASATLMLSPSYIVDLGWLLSFGSFAGVMIYAPMLQAYFFGRKKKRGFLVQILFETISAQLLVLPILVFAFGQVSLVSVFANLLILPTIPITMLLVFATGLSVLTLPWLGAAMGWCTGLLLDYHLMVMNYFGSLEWATATVQMGWLGAALCYALLIALGLYLKRVTKIDLLNSNIID
ncbi:MAG: ComEC/Rec2 family competence protein [Candidatus Nomurabacteria bacterium]|jgi:competence protein ComEC|nr:ComEC/Rec2 family competence protein [Candidatus Nomurabacteria bacterium]